MPAFDESLFHWIYGLSHLSVLADNIAVLIARDMPYLLVIGFFVLLTDVRGARRRTFMFAQAAIITLVSRGIVVETIRFFYDRPRPFSVFGFDPLMPQSPLEPSFPSGHAAFFFGLAFAVWQMNRTWGIWYLVAAFLNGFARIFVGVHWPLDVAIGAAIGALSAFIVIRFASEHYPHPPEVIVGGQVLEIPDTSGENETLT
ncbi:MAG: hypothetical protein RL681_127 [Candidatus Parcubacteria bacterium]|jgi:undecaprenyl-diphosphatase